jgi:hypothetical protein
VRHCLGTVPHAKLAEQPAGVRLDCVLGQVELPADLAVALALAHPPQHLQLALGELPGSVGAGGVGTAVLANVWANAATSSGRDASQRR